MTSGSWDSSEVRLCKRNSEWQVVVEILRKSVYEGATQNDAFMFDSAVDTDFLYSSIVIPFFYVIPSEARNLVRITLWDSSEVRLRGRNSEWQVLTVKQAQLRMTGGFTVIPSVFLCWF